MNLLDLVILLAALAYAFTGFRNGAVVGVLSLVGFFSGAILGAQLAEPLGSRLAHGRAQVPVAIVCVLFLAMLGQLLGTWLGSHLKQRFVRNVGRQVDSGVGAVLGVLSVLLVAWMIAVPLASSPYPSLASEASQSSIVRGVNDAMPDGMRALYGKLRGFLDQSGFPPVFGDLPSTTIVNVPAPASLTPAEKRQVHLAAQSTFKVYGQAPSCGRGIEGSGFVVSPHHIMTNAHVVAGTRQVSIVVGDHQLAATVVLYDPDRDVAVLDVPDLSARPLRFAPTPAGTGNPAVVMGYPQDGPLNVQTARVRARTTVSGSDIYGNAGVRREVYSIRSLVRSGNSGGPLLASNGRVLGVVFATDLRSSDTGYVLTAAEVASAFREGRRETTPVNTGSCTPG
ncbi:MAG TPA: MarP family serine protease [Jatrophihabitans sp.]